MLYNELLFCYDIYTQRTNVYMWPTAAGGIKMKRYRIKNRVRFTAFMAAFVLVFVISVSSLLGYNDATGMDIPEYTVIRVQAGDTLWGLAGQYGPENADIRQLVYVISRINGVTASTLRPGMDISIPTIL